MLSIPDFSKSKILVVGDIMLDRYWHGGAKRISPEAPVPVVSVKQTINKPGGAANVALNLAVLGCDVTLLGITGQDEAGACVKHQLGESKIKCHFITDKKLPTITKLRIISQHQQLIRMDFEEDLSCADLSSLKSTFHHLLDSADVILFSDYAKGTLAEIKALIGLARKAKKYIIVDPKGNDFEKYKGVNLLTPNSSEFEAVAGSASNNSAVEEKALKLAECYQFEALLVTRGEQGMSLIQPNEDPKHIQAKAKEVYDVTGAGDTVISVLAAAYAAKFSLQDAADLSNIAAGIVVGKLGTATVTKSELRMALKENQEHDQGILSESQLLECVMDAKIKNEKVVMTNGCFDILHAGHVSYLEQARQKGDRLIVAVNDDNSVKRLKGGNRPIVPLEQRMAVLAGLSSVDWVVSFSEDTPERLICSVLPNVLVKGGDYEPEDIAGYSCIKAHGGEVEVMSFLNGSSTTKIIKSITEDGKRDE